MALLLIEGFDHFTSDAHLEDKGWDIGSGSGFITVGSAYGRFGGNGVKVINSVCYLRKNIGSDESTIYFGVAIKIDVGTPGGYYAVHGGFIELRDEANTIQVRFYIGSDYKILAYQGDGTLLGTATVACPFQKWFYLEGKIVIHATTGAVELKMNGTQVLNLTSQDTKNGTDYIRYIQFGSIYDDIDTLFDDVYVDDAAYHGDCRVKVFLPDDVSTTNNSFTASAGNKDECVDDNPPTDDTDYIYSDTLNHKQGFGITTGSLGTVIGIQLNNFCRIDEAGTRKITPLIRSNSTDYQGTETDIITADYKFESEVFEDDPDDSNPWTQTKLEAAEFGLEITT
jgi:hypothetical protein